MNSFLRNTLGATACALLPLTGLAASPSSAPGTSEARMKANQDGATATVDIQSDRDGARKEIRIRHGGRPAEMETVTFLGVETAPASKTLITQLSLPDNAGLVVLHVVPDSGAANVLKEHDILLKLDDQILIDEHQLSVLVRNHKEGDEVTLTYVRGAKQATAKIKLTKHEVPKFGDVFHKFQVPIVGPHVKTFGLSSAGEGREDVNRMLAMIDRAHQGERAPVEIEQGKNAFFRATTIRPDNSNLVFSDEQGTLELKTKDGIKTLVAKNAKGEPLFSGPIETPEDRKKLPADLRERLEKLESMEDVTFHADRDFEGVETKVVTPAGRPIEYREVRRAVSPPLRAL